MIYLEEDLPLPDVSQADDDGLLAVGGKLTSARLLEAYRNGIFPWYSEDQPILWWSPDPRMVLFPEKLKVSKSLKQTLQKNKFSVTCNRDFVSVIKNCSSIKRKGQRGTWITAEMQEAYIKLHQAGHALSVEVWQEEELAGGLYGIDLPDRKIFCGESMFHNVTDASKVAFIHLVEEMKTRGYSLIDCQVYNRHLSSLGAEEIPREVFMRHFSIKK